MNKQIKTFIGTDALKAVEADKETAGRLLCEAVGMRCLEIRKYVCETRSCSVCNLVNCGDLNAVAEIEEKVIEKVGCSEYAEYLSKVITDGEFPLYPQIVFIVDNSITGHYSGLFFRIGKIATAPAEQRIAAMLTALSEVEK